MPDDKKISELTTAESNSSSDLFETAIPNGLSETGYVSRKVTANALALLYANTIQFSSQLQTTAKTLIGAINEVAQGGSSSSVILGTTDPTSATGSNGNLYIKYDGTSYAVLGMWVKINNDWRAVELGGASDLGDLDDVTFTTPAERQCVTYDNANDVWINRDVVKPMAQSDYDNLPSAKQQDGTLYITDGTPPSATVTGSDVLYFTDVSDSNKPKSTTAAALAGLANTYSTTEMVVGKWTDGSTLYEQTIEVNNPTSTTVTDYDYFNLAELNVNADIGFFVSGYAIRNDNRRLSLPYNRFYTADNTLIPEIYIDYATGKISVSITKLSSWNVTINKVAITVRYTKKSL